MYRTLPSPWSPSSIKSRLKLAFQNLTSLVRNIVFGCCNCLRWNLLDGCCNFLSLRSTIYSCCHCLSLRNFPRCDFLDGCCDCLGFHPRRLLYSMFYFSHHGEVDSTRLIYQDEDIEAKPRRCSNSSIKSRRRSLSRIWPILRKVRELCGQAGWF